MQPSAQPWVLFWPPVKACVDVGRGGLLGLLTLSLSCSLFHILYPQVFSYRNKGLFGESSEELVLSLVAILSLSFVLFSPVFLTVQVVPDNNAKGLLFKPLLPLKPLQKPVQLSATCLLVSGRPRLHTEIQFLLQ